MDMNQFMQHHLDLNVRIAVALETIAGYLSGYKASDKPMSVAGGAKVTPADTPLEEANQIARDSAAAAQDKQKAEAAAAATKKKAEAAAAAKAAKELADKAAQEAADLEAAMGGGEEAAAPKRTIDEVRAALKAMAGREGNPAAMALLATFKCKAVSELPTEQYNEFILACG